MERGGGEKERERESQPTQQTALKWSRKYSVAGENGRMHLCSTSMCNETLFQAVDDFKQLLWLCCS